jgi:hypothetical protein
MSNRTRTERQQARHRRASFARRWRALASAYRVSVSRDGSNDEPPIVLVPIRVTIRSEALRIIEADSHDNVLPTQKTSVACLALEQ